MTLKQLQKLVEFLEFVPADCTVQIRDGTWPVADVLTPRYPSGDNPFAWEIEWDSTGWRKR